MGYGDGDVISGLQDDVKRLTAERDKWKSQTTWLENFAGECHAAMEKAEHANMMLTLERHQLREANAKMLAVCQQVTLDPGYALTTRKSCAKRCQRTSRSRDWPKAETNRALLWEQTEGTASKPDAPN